MLESCNENHDTLAWNFEDKLKKLISRFELLTIQTFGYEEVSLHGISLNQMMSTGNDTVEDMSDDDYPSQDMNTAPTKADLIMSIEGIITEEEPDEDILIIADKLLKQATHVKTRSMLKTIMILTVVVLYKTSLHLE